MSSAMKSNDPQYEIWKPISSGGSAPHVECIVDGENGLIISLVFEKDDGHQLVFESMVAYRNINESYRDKTWIKWDKLKASSSFFTVSNSPWIDWLKTESNGVLDHIHLTHYCIFTDEDCVEIVTEFAPEVHLNLQTLSSDVC